MSNVRPLTAQHQIKVTMPTKIKSITAIGTRGKVKGKHFFAIRRNGKFVLHSEALAAKSGKATRFAVNQVLVDSLEDAAALLHAGGYHIRLYNDEYNQWNLRTATEVRIELA